MSTSNPTIPPETARHVLYHFDPAHVGGTQPDTFTQNLIRAFATADENNFRHLSSLYPGYGHAVTLAKYDPQGLFYLQGVADANAIRCTRCGDEDGPFTDDDLCEACARPMPLAGAA